MARQRPRPIIGITGPARGAFGPRLCIGLGVWLAGGRPRQLRPGETEALSDVRGFVVSGGHDVDPVLYGAESEVKPNYDPDRDVYESKVIDRALAEDLPLLGICRGAQLLNVRLNGTLVQDLSSHRRRTSKRRTLLPLKTVRIESGTRMAGILGGSVHAINSLHNQAIDRLGNTLNVSGRDLDGIVQAVEERCFQLRSRRPVASGVPALLACPAGSVQPSGVGREGRGA